MLATPKQIEETRMRREAVELQHRILKTQCDQALAERDELVGYKVSTQKRIEELEERRSVYELKYPPELDVDAISRRLEALPAMDEMQVGPSCSKTTRFGDKRELQTALRQVCVREYSSALSVSVWCFCKHCLTFVRRRLQSPSYSSNLTPGVTFVLLKFQLVQLGKIVNVAWKCVWTTCAILMGALFFDAVHRPFHLPV